MKTAVDGQFIAMEVSIAGLMRQLRVEVAESQELLKHEVMEDFVQQISAASCLHFHSPFLPTASTPLDVVGEATGQVGDATTMRGTYINQQQPATLEGKIPWDAYDTLKLNFGTAPLHLDAGSPGPLSSVCLHP